MILTWFICVLVHCLAGKWPAVFLHHCTICSGLEATLFVIFPDTLLHWWTSHLTSSSTPDGENTPQTIIPPPPCFTVAERHSWLNFSPDLRRQFSSSSVQSSNRDSSLQRTRWNHWASCWPWSHKNLSLSATFLDRNGFFAHRFDENPAALSLLVIVLLEKIWFFEFLNSCANFVRIVLAQSFSAFCHLDLLSLWVFQNLFSVPQNL